MKTKKYIYGILMMLILSGGCVEDAKDHQPLFVVEAFIYSGEHVEGIKIKELTPLDSGSEAKAPIISKAVLVISKEENSFQLEFDMESGSYYYPGSDLEILPDETIRIDARVNEREAYGETIVPPVPKNVRAEREVLVVPELTVSLDLRDRIIELFESARLKVEWDNESGDLYYVVIESRETEWDPILPEVVPEEAKELLSSFRFISEPTEVPSFDVVGVALETYGTHVAKVYRVNDEYSDLFQNDTQDSRDLNAPPTNMVGAFGIFSAFASDSVVFEVLRE